MASQPPGAANTARSFTELRSRAGTAEAREGQRLIIGPWDHLNSTGSYPDRRFGLTADAITTDLTSEHLRFFDRWLRGRPAAGTPPRSRSWSWASTSGARSRTVLTEPVEVTGHVSVTLFASSSAPDTDFTGKLVDVFPDGRAIFLTDGILRARYRNSLAEPEPLTPGPAHPSRLILPVIRR